MGEVGLDGCFARCIAVIGRLGGCEGGSVRTEMVGVTGDV